MVWKHGFDRGIGLPVRLKKAYSNLTCGPFGTLTKFPQATAARNTLLEMTKTSLEARVQLRDKYFHKHFQHSVPIIYCEPEQ